jgi:hypothetical protein
MTNQEKLKSKLLDQHKSFPTMEVIMSGPKNMSKKMRTTIIRMTDGMAFVPCDQSTVVLCASVDGAEIIIKKDMPYMSIDWWLQYLEEKKEEKVLDLMKQHKQRMLEVWQEEKNKDEVTAN